jgi:Cu/Ag efflux pump CusA
VTGFLGFSGIIGSEFLPHLDEGAIWVRGTLAPSASLTECVRSTTQARLILASFPEAIKVVSEVGRPDDGTDTGGFGNTEYFVDLKPKDQWRPVFRQDKEELIAAMNRELEKLPGATWNFSQPIEDNVGETESGTKDHLAAKLLGIDLTCEMPMRISRRAIKSCASTAREISTRPRKTKTSANTRTSGAPSVCSIFSTPSAAIAPPSLPIGRR